MGEQLKFLAARESLSLSAFAVRSLTEIARRADNPALLGDLPGRRGTLHWVIVVDASAAVLGLLYAGDARRRLATDTVAIPHLADAEVANTLRTQVRRGVIDVGDGRRALRTWARLGIERFPIVGLLDRVWALRENLTAHDATYVALAETLDCTLVSADARLGRAPGPMCPITIVRR